MTKEQAKEIADNYSIDEVLRHIKNCCEKGKYRTDLYLSNSEIVRLKELGYIISESPYDPHPDKGLAYLLTDNVSL